MCVHLKKLGESRGYREGHGEFLCDGVKLLEEAVMSGAAVTDVLTASHLPFPLPLETRVFYAERALIDTVSPLKNAQDVLFACKMPEEQAAAGSEGTLVLLDGVQDPGNVGAMIRTANAFGIGRVLLTGACADVYNPKTVRASMGAVFRQRVTVMAYGELEALRAGGARFIGAVPGLGRRLVSDANLHGAVIAIGGEGGGLSGSVLALCDETVTIPLAPGCESLNAAVAAAILMWEASKTKNEK